MYKNSSVQKKVATIENIVWSCHRKKKLTLEKCHLLALGEIQQAIEASRGSFSWFQWALAHSHCFSQFIESIWFFDSRDWIEQIILILIMRSPAWLIQVCFEWLHACHLYCWCRWAFLGTPRRPRARVLPAAVREAGCMQEQGTGWCCFQRPSRAHTHFNIPNLQILIKSNVSGIILFSTG